MKTEVPGKKCVGAGIGRYVPGTTSQAPGVVGSRVRIDKGAG